MRDNVITLQRIWGSLCGLGCFKIHRKYIHIWWIYWSLDECVYFSGSPQLDNEGVHSCPFFQNRGRQGCCQCRGALYIKSGKLVGGKSVHSCSVRHTPGRVHPKQPTIRDNQHLLRQGNFSHLLDLASWWWKEWRNISLPQIWWATKQGEFNPFLTTRPARVTPPRF